MTDNEILVLLKKYPFLIIKDYNGKSIYSKKDLPEHNYYTYWDNTGWKNIWRKFLHKIFEVYDTLNDKEKSLVMFYDIKEKWGALRIELVYPLTRMEFNDIIKQVELLSEVTCIKCGKLSKDSRGNPVIWTTRGYMVPLCKKCAKKSLIERGYNKAQITKKLLEMRSIQSEFIITSESKDDYKEVHYRVSDDWIKATKIIKMEWKPLNKK
jgi:hypothetical protein